MSMLLFIIGGIAVMAGAATVAFGIPINEFSFGNTLIVSGATVGTGGLIIIAIAAAVAQLRRISETLGARAGALPYETHEPPPEARPAPTPGRIPFPRKPKAAEADAHEPQDFAAPAHAEMAEEEHPGQSFAPALRNPEAPPTLEEEVSLSPQNPSTPAPVEFGGPAKATPLPAGEPALEAPWLSPPPVEAPASNFDAMWPAKPAKPQESVAPASAPQPAPAPPPASQPRAVAILKSGVVDGMGYTLYVDGSIEAELPQGTLRFASIDELRAHLEKGA